MTTYELPELGIPARLSPDGSTVEIGHTHVIVKDVPMLKVYYGTRLAEVVRAGELIDSEEEAKKRSAEDARVEEGARVIYQSTHGVCPPVSTLSHRSAFNPYRQAARDLLKAIDAGLV